MIKLAYCDYIAHLIQSNLLVLDTNELLDQVSKVQYDLGLQGEFCSTMKTIDVQDTQGKLYRITVQEL